MEVTTTVSCRARVSAGLEEDGTLVLKVFGSAEYAKGRSTTAEVGVPDALAAPIRTALAAILADAGVLKRLGKEINKSIHKSAEIAAAHGEI